MWQRRWMTDSCPHELLLLPLPQRQLLLAIIQQKRTERRGSEGHD